MTYRNRWAMVGVLMIAIFALPTGLIWGGHVLEQHPAFCASCHEMQSSYDGWMASGASTHHPTCIECHSGAGVAGLLESELRGLRMVALHLQGGAQPGHAIPVTMPEQFCLKCHQAEKLIVSHAPLQTAGHACADCHKHRAGWRFSGQLQ